jgi:ApaG protein
MRWSVSPSLLRYDSLMTVAVPVRITAVSQFVPDHSDPKNGRYFFAYRITIENRGAESVQLISRHWVITDANHKVEEVSGDGVIGEQPLIAPGKAYSYTSFCPLRTEFGTMHGEFRMRGESGEFDAEIPQFILSCDNTVN